jgi:hypothetical protein
LFIISPVSLPIARDIATAVTTSTTALIPFAALQSWSFHQWPGHGSSVVDVRTDAGGVSRQGPRLG